MLDTGCRAQEFVDLDLEDVNVVSGEVHIKHGKGDKSRVVFLGQKAKRALKVYLYQRSDPNPALWINDEQNRLSYSGLRQIIRRRAKRAGVKEPALHSFRRAFAINMLRSGVDIYSLRQLMGHADIQVLQRYLKLEPSDLAAAHQRGSPVDKSL